MRHEPSRVKRKKPPEELWSCLRFIRDVCFLFYSYPPATGGKILKLSPSAKT